MRRCVSTAQADVVRSTVVAQGELAAPLGCFPAAVVDLLARLAVEAQPGVACAAPAERRAPWRGDRHMSRFPLPPFTHETAVQKVRMAEDAWNTRDPERVASAYTVDSRWRNRAEFVNGRDEIVAFLTRKWNRELDYRLIKELWAVEGNCIAVRFAYESHDDSGNWYRSYGNENWEFDENGLMRRRHASINDLRITEDERLFHWPQGRRPDDHPGLSDLGL
jgi:nuclear transport factor 2 (NTF2) superfamily protein